MLSGEVLRNPMLALLFAVPRTHSKILWRTHMQITFTNRPTSHPEPLVITHQHTADFICARTPISLETPPEYFDRVMRGLQKQADEGQLTQEDIAKIAQEAIIERARRESPDFWDEL